MIKIAPSILSADFGNMQSEVENIARWGGDIVHCDVMDGVFVPNLTFGMPLVKAIRKITDLPIDAHLMIAEPEKYALRFVDAGADSVSFHPEASKDPLKLLKEIRAAGALAGFALNPDVPFRRFESLALSADFVVVMSVYAGFGGQKMIPECLEKCAAIAKRLSALDCPAILELDGGITESNARAARDAGASWIVAGSAVFGSNDPAETIRILREG